ncbi:MAG: 50S ribosomal protein L10 [Methylacidiphilales bacterium]|nr:50S ribosomal protein L10 [Candidatus Methylacidiphilales bacterium]MDW8350130.1 50S ribosomal protein L10 [Verrucomicrobiae bacterium]
MRPEKNSIVDWIKSKINRSPYVIIINYTGLKVSEFNELRNRLYKVNAQCRVTKNTLLRRALRELNLPDYTPGISGQTAVVFGQSDVCAAAKVLKNFIDEFKKPSLKGGILESAIVTQDQILSLADLPSKEVLLAQILGLLKAPANKLAQLLNTPASQLAYLIKAKNG